MFKGSCSYSACEKEGEKCCGACKGVIYCSIECQKADWPSHRLSCQKRENNHVPDSELLHQFNSSDALYLVALACYMNDYPIEDFRGARITFNNNLLAQPNYKDKLWESSSIRLMFEAGLQDMIDECQRAGCKGMDFDTSNPSAFLFIVHYNSATKVFTCSRENIQGKIDHIKDFSTKNGGRR